MKSVKDETFHFLFLDNILVLIAGNPYDLVETQEEIPSPLANWKSVPHLTPLNLYYDVTPPELVTAVVTEVAILPCTSMLFKISSYLHSQQLICNYFLSDAYRCAGHFT